MTTQKPRQYCIQGLTLEGRTFRPGDWAERLAGAMSSFRPGGGKGGIGSFIGYSPYCVPQVIDEVKCVLVSEALRGIEPMAWDFVMNFARDNHLQVAEVCALPEGEPALKQQCRAAKKDPSIEGGPGMTKGPHQRALVASAASGIRQPVRAP